MWGDFPGGAVDRNPPANAGDVKEESQSHPDHLSSLLTYNKESHPTEARNLELLNGAFRISYNMKITVSIKQCIFPEKHCHH